MATEKRTYAKRAYAWLVVAMLWFVCLFNYADRQAIFSVFSLLQSEFALSDVQLGVIAGCFMWAYALFGPIAGWIADRIPRKTLILAALVFWSAITAATAIAHSYPQLILVRALGGLGEAFYFPAAMSLIAAYHGPTTRSRAMAFHQSSVYIGTIAGGSLSGYIAERSGWRDSFAVFGALDLLALILLFTLREPEPEPEEIPARPATPSLNTTSPLQVLRQLARSRATLLLIAVFIGANFVAVVFLTWLPSFLQRKFHMHLAAADFNATAWLQLASIAGVVFGGLLADGMRLRWQHSRQRVQAIGLLAAVPFLFLIGSSLTVVGLIAGMAGFGLFKGMYDANIWASLYDVVPAGRRGFATGLMNSLGWLGAGIAPIAIASGAAHSSLGACLSATSAIYLLLAAALFYFFR